MQEITKHYPDNISLHQRRNESRRPLLWFHKRGTMRQILPRCSQRPCQFGFFTKRIDKTAARTLRWQRKNNETHQGVFRR